MNSLLLLVPLSLVLVVVAGWAFAWAVKRGQFDDLDTPSLDILVDDTLVDDTLVGDTLVDGAVRAGPGAPAPGAADTDGTGAGAAAVRDDA